MDGVWGWIKQKEKEGSRSRRRKRRRKIKRRRRRRRLRRISKRSRRRSTRRRGQRGEGVEGGGEVAEWSTRRERGGENPGPLCLQASAQSTVPPKPSEHMRKSFTTRTYLPSDHHVCSSAPESPLNWRFSSCLFPAGTRSLYLKPGLSTHISLSTVLSKHISLSTIVSKHISLQWSHCCTILKDMANYWT